MWVNASSRKYPVSACQPAAHAWCKAKEVGSAQQPVTMPASWKLSENQRSFIESLMDMKSK